MDYKNMLHNGSEFTFGNRVFRNIEAQVFYLSELVDKLDPETLEGLPERMNTLEEAMDDLVNDVADLKEAETEIRIAIAKLCPITFFVKIEPEDWVADTEVEDRYTCTKYVDASLIPLDDDATCIVAQTKTNDGKTRPVEITKTGNVGMLKWERYGEAEDDETMIITALYSNNIPED